MYNLIQFPDSQTPEGLLLLHSTRVVSEINRNLKIIAISVVGPSLKYVVSSRGTRMVAKDFELVQCDTVIQKIMHTCWAHKILL